MNAAEKRFSGQEVFEMVWAVLDAIDDEVRRNHTSKLVLPNNIIAHAVRCELEDGMSPVGLYVKVNPDGFGGGGLSWYGYVKNETERPVGAKERK